MSQSTNQAQGYPRGTIRDERLWLWWLALAALLGATWLAYMKGLTGGWLLDDYGNIVDNAALAMHPFSWAALWNAMWSFHAGPLGRPISLATFALQRHFAGLDPYAFKALNLGLHLVTTVLLIGFTRSLLRAWRARHAPQIALEWIDWTALAIGAAWALHPVNLTAVLYAVQRETILGALFSLAGLWAYVELRQRLATTWATAVLLAAVLGLFGFLAAFSKETGALLPLLTLLLEFTVLGFRDRDGEYRRKLWVLYVCVLLLPGIAGLWWTLPGIVSQSAYVTRSFTLAGRVLTETRVVVFYLGLILAPRLSAMTLYHDDIAISSGVLAPPTTLLSILLIGALLIAGWMLRKRSPLVSLGILWFFAAQALESTIWPLEIAYEHRLYLADWGIILAVAALTLLAARSLRMRRLVAIAAILAVAALGLATAKRAWDWRSNLSLARTEAHNHPNSPRSTYLLSRIYTNLALDGDNKYVPLAYQASEKAAHVPRSGLDPWVAMVLLAAQTGGEVHEEWFDGMVKAVGEEPFTVSDVNALEALVGCVTRDQCDVKRSDIERLFRAIYNSPRLKKLGMNYANVLVTEANFIGYDTPAERARSAPLLEKAAEVQPGIAQFQENVFNVALDDERFDLARKALQRVEKSNKLGRLDLVVARMKRTLRERTAEARAASRTPASAPAAASAPSARSGGG